MILVINIYEIELILDKDFSINTIFNLNRFFLKGDIENNYKFRVEK